MTANPKACLLCEHWNYIPGSPHFSDKTPGSPAGMRCGKGHWEWDPDDDKAGDFRAKILMAETCKDWKRVKV